MPRLAVSVSFHTALWNKLLSSHYSEARGALLSLVQPSLFLQVFIHLVVPFSKHSSRVLHRCC